mmetsp:Transcript_10750/g.33512  ORF Transcript_10750/g.33512 Transcript_10750/m.33512 type:complete len:255 (+) Transcript_10750:75-839(+)
MAKSAAAIVRLHLLTPFCPRATITQQSAGAAADGTPQPAPAKAASASANASGASSTKATSTSAPSGTRSIHAEMSPSESLSAAPPSMTAIAWTPAANPPRTSSMTWQRTLNVTKRSGTHPATAVAFATTGFSTHQPSQQLQPVAEAESAPLLPVGSWASVAATAGEPPLALAAGSVQAASSCPARLAGPTSSPRPSSAESAAYARRHRMSESSTSACAPRTAASGISTASPNGHQALGPLPQGASVDHQSALLS